MIHGDPFDPVNQLQHQCQLELFGGVASGHNGIATIYHPMLILCQGNPVRDQTPQILQPYHSRVIGFTYLLQRKRRFNETEKSGCKPC